MQNQRLTFTLPAAVGSGYAGVCWRCVLESSTDLIEWTPERSGVANGSKVEDPIDAGADQKIYRLAMTVE
ncbi:MAG: hypothetical protein KJO79_06225 [Verrucomicrobiae bacterium]|nr:hypothetical protein [Verrucomicrobiae bacterium]NNJ86758.1 hypothetical protein [Akkermansiaceae bacterium]